MNDKFETMSDAELNDAAGLIMGWIEDGNRWVTPNGLIVDYDPANDLNHASEFGAAFLAKWPQTHTSVRVGVGGVDCAVYGYDGYAICMIYSQASEPRARTLAVLRAWTALNG